MTFSSHRLKVCWQVLILLKVHKITENSIFVIKRDTKINLAQILMFNICSWQPRLHTCTLIVHLLPNCMLAVLKALVQELQKMAINPMIACEARRKFYCQATVSVRSKDDFAEHCNIKLECNHEHRAMEQARL